MPTRERPVGRGVSLHVAWPGSRTSRAADTLSCGRGVHGHTRSGADDESRTRGLDHGVVALCQSELHPQKCKTDHRPVPRSSSRGKLLKSVRRFRRCDPSIAIPAPMRGTVGLTRTKQKGPDPCGIRACSKAELGGRAPMRLPLPDARGPRPDQASESSLGRPDARPRRTHPTTPWPWHARTRPDPVGVGCM